MRITKSATARRTPSSPPAAPPALAVVPPRAKPYTLDEVAQELNCDRSHVWRIMRELRAYNIAAPGSPRACWRVDPADLEAFKRSRQLKPA